MRAAITAVLPDPAPAIACTGPIRAVIAASCSGVGSWPRSAAQNLLGTAPVVGLTARHPPFRAAGPAEGCRWGSGLRGWAGARNSSPWGHMGQMGLKGHMAVGVRVGSRRTRAPPRREGEQPLLGLAGVVGARVLADPGEPAVHDLAG